MASAKPLPAYLTDTTYVYVLGIPGGPYKIGHSRTPRLRAMAARREGRGPACVVREWEVNRYRVARAAEAYAHWLLRDRHYQSEWFNVTEAEAIAAVEHALRPEAVEAYDAREVIPAITQSRKGDEMFSLKLAKGTAARIGAVIGKPRGHSDYVRAAVEEKLARDEASPSPPSSPR